MKKLDQTLSDFNLTTDKASHGYLSFYDKILPDQVVSILELGVKEGESIRLWKHHYPNAKIYGLDLFQEYPIPDIEGVTFFKGSQCDEDILYHIRNDIKPQVIIEDASHNCIFHWVTLFSLIPCCEMYIIEDLHTCQDEFYRQGLSFNQTVLGSMLSGGFPFRFELYQNKIAVIYAT